MSTSIYFCFLVLVTLFHFCLSNRNVHDVLCLDFERQALVEFKHGLIDEAGRLASWVDEERDCCRWVGIVCDNITGHVQGIHLRGLDCLGDEEDSNQLLKGKLSSSLLHLKQLTHLDLSYNDFGGIKVPKFIGSLGNLRYLNLSRSSFGGVIPHQLGNLSKLQVLGLGSYSMSNELTGMMNMQWLSNLCMLHHLDMSGIDLSKATDWVQVINFLPSLVQLHLSSCQLPDIHHHVPSRNITSLSSLDLSSNDFFHDLIPRWIFSITSLVSLNLNECQLPGFTLGSSYSFHNLTSLESLHLSAQNFMNSTLVLEELSSSVASNLISLDISSCGVTSSDLKSLHNLTSLLSIDLSHNQLTKAIPKSLGILCKLREINLSYNSFGNTSLTDLLKSFLKCKSPSLESLSLIHSGISGHIPHEVGKIIHLVHLLLHANHISGAIPASIGQLSSLEVLDLSHNQLNGSLCESIGQLSTLKTLLLPFNQLNGNIPNSIGRLSSLKVLDLSYNLFNGNLPYSIGRLSSVEVLDLKFNQLKGRIPDSLGQLSKLYDLDLSYNFMTGVVTEAHFAKLASLKSFKGTSNNLALRPRIVNWIPPFQMHYLYLNSWDLGPQFPLWLQSQSDLRELDISNTNISSPMPPSFLRSFPKITILDMSQNRIQGTLTLLDISAVDIDGVLDLSSNEFKGNFTRLSNASFPWLLDLSNNLFAGSLHHFVCSNGVHQTSILDLGNNHFSGVIPKCWDKWQRLAILNLENNNLSGTIPPTLCVLSVLSLLNLHGNKLTGSLPSSLMNLTYLEILQLGRNELVGSIPTWFGKELSSLRLLNLMSNNFVGNIPRELCNLDAIQILELADNNLSGNIPRCFNNFSVLSGKAKYNFFSMSISYDKYTLNSDSLVLKGREDTYRSILELVMLVDLSSNNLVGDIPSEFTTLIKLKSLNLSRNQLTGRIPEKIGDLKELESFDLSLNKLCGELPTSLSSLNFLSSFNVSYNNFTGRIPMSTQLQTLNESSFFGNKLCGTPLSEQCVLVEVPISPDQKEENESHIADWGLIISIVLGFVAGFWILVAPLIVNRSWRIAYFRFISSFVKCGNMLCK